MILSTLRNLLGVMVVTVALLAQPHLAQAAPDVAPRQLSRPPPPLVSPQVFDEIYTALGKPEVVSEKMENEFWERLRNEDSEDSYRFYIDVLPSGRFIWEAQVRLDELKRFAVEIAHAPVMISIPGYQYEIGKYEVTQGEWKRVMGSNPSRFTNCGDDCPVEQVSWNDVQEYIRKLNVRTGRQYRLPSKGEWFYACLGGKNTVYCGSDNLDRLAWHGGDQALIASNSGEQTHPVGQKLPNGYGLFDMSGNVMEWISDCYKEDCKEHSLKGGSWFSSEYFAQAYNLYIDSNDAVFPQNGFRLARQLPLQIIFEQLAPLSCAPSCADGTARCVGIR
ncbi:MAG: SUMF1/EgtB/PvdO family nonheme iron enzyme [Gallionellaceae bacterium]